jgi:hemolysin III
MCILISFFKNSLIGLFSSIVFGTSMIALYTVSSVYHGLRGGTAKKVFQVIDHCTIYFLIAGTYTPMLLCSLIKVNPVAAWSTFAIVWGLTALAVTLNAIDLKKYKVFSMISYVVVGWAILPSVTLMFDAIGSQGFSLLLGGGLLYTAGVIFYAFGSKKRYFHSIFHLFVLAGSIAHSLSVMFFVI